MTMIDTSAQACGAQALLAPMDFKDFAAQVVETIEGLCEDLEEEGLDHNSLAPLTAMLGFDMLAGHLRLIGQHALDSGDTILQQMLTDIGVLVEAPQETVAQNG